MPDEVDRVIVLGYLRDVLSGRLSGDPPDFAQVDLVDDLGLDSLDLIALLFDIQDRFGVDIADEDIGSLGLLQVGALADYVANQVTGRAP